MQDQRIDRRNMIPEQRYSGFSEEGQRVRDCGQIEV